MALETNTTMPENREMTETLLRRKMRVNPPCIAREPAPKVQTSPPEKQDEGQIA